MLSIFKIFYKFFSILLFLSIFICIFFLPAYPNSSNPPVILEFIDDGSLLWPAPGISKINSYFGKRASPTTGASSYHKGIDIGAPEGCNFVAVTDGVITFVGFLGGGGYTITLTDHNSKNGEIKYSYCHCNPDFIVCVGENVVKGQLIGRVGPKYVSGVSRKSLY